jgi:hypothetical protein
MSAIPSKAFKVTVGSVSAVVGIAVALVPYVNLVQRVDAHDTEIKSMRTKAESDHDLTIKMSSDITYIKETVQDLKLNRR